MEQVVDILEKCYIDYNFHFVNCFVRENKVYFNITIAVDKGDMKLQLWEDVKFELFDMDSFHSFCVLNPYENIHEFEIEFHCRNSHWTFKFIEKN